MCRLPNDIGVYVLCRAVSSKGNTQRASDMSQHPDPCFSDDTVRGILNFLLRTKYYEEAPDYGGVHHLASFIRVHAYLRGCAQVFHGACPASDILGPRAPEARLGPRVPSRMPNRYVEV